jgi:hypothetical protein
LHTVTIGHQKQAIWSAEEKNIQINRLILDNCFKSLIISIDKLERTLIFGGQGGKVNKRKC